MGIRLQDNQYLEKVSPQLFHRFDWGDIYCLDYALTSYRLVFLYKEFVTI